MLNRLQERAGEEFTLRAAGGYDYRIVQSAGHHHSGIRGYTPNAIKEALHGLGLWDVLSEEKFIPGAYLGASRSVRLDVLRGLIDTDGWVERWGSVRFGTSSERLARDVAELVRSLGGWCTIRNRRPTYTYKGEQRIGKPSFVCNIHHPDPQSLVLLSDKLGRITGKPRRNWRPVFLSVEPTRIAGAQCISVTHPDHLYITDDYVVTHNTSFAMNIAEHAAIKEKTPVVVFSMEMSAEQLTMRMMSSLGRIDQHKVRTGRLDDDDWPRLTSSVNILDQTSIFIDDTPALSPADLRARARRLKREHNIGMVVVDYLQLMQVTGTQETRTNEISEISRSLKALAKELQVPVIALSQLNRNLEQRPNKRPVMSDLRESGSIEQDADVIMFIYRDEVYNEDSKDKGIAEVAIAKQRNGPTGTVRLTFLGQYTRFENYIPNVYP
ncbi:MAG: AAA family ATPase [Gammaproteobacteria bacterium]|nr:AAA family ATPase [Gammaproteobacteria bacterium]